MMYYFCKKCWNRWRGRPTLRCPRCEHFLTNVTKDVKIKTYKDQQLFKEIPPLPPTRDESYYGG